MNVPLGDLMPSKKVSVDPRRTPEREFELFSIPAYDAGMPEIVEGREVGSSKQVVESGDVLLSKIVPHIRRAWVVDRTTDRPAIGSSEWIVFRSNRFEPSYLRHVLMSDRFHQAFMQTVAGVGGSLLRARPTYVAEIEVPLPPIEEQRRIAAILDASDALRAKRRQTIAKLDTLTQAIFIDMFGDPVKNEREWRFQVLEDVTDGIFDCPHSTPKWTDNGLVCLRTSNLGRGVWDWADTRYVSRDTFEQRSKRAYLEPDDIVLSREGTVGIAALVETDMRVCMGQRLVQVRADRRTVRPRFLLDVLLFLLAPDRIGRVMAGSTAKHLNVKELRALAVITPPASIQDRYIAAVEGLVGIRAGMLEAGQHLDTLFDSLQQRAFRGEL